MTDRRLTLVPPPVALSLAVAACFHALLWPIVMDDVAHAYVPWLRHIVATGPIAVFGAPFADYAPPYLYLLALFSPLYGLLSGPDVIKLLSLGGTVALACAVGRLLRTLGVAHAARWAALVGALPTTMLNTALLGQCDALYAAPCIMALDAAVARRDTRMLLWCGVALAIKMQAVLFAPFVIALLIRRRTSLHRWAIVPAVVAASLVPAWALGWPAEELLSIYYRQTHYSPLPALNAPNLWFVLQALLPHATAQLSTLALTSAVGVTGCYIVRAATTLPDGVRLLPFAALAVLLTAGLLPHMHERYFFVGDIVTFAWAASAATRRAWVAAGAVQLGSTLAVCGYIFDAAPLVMAGFLAMTAATWSIATLLLRPAANDTPLMARAGT